MRIGNTIASIAITSLVIVISQETLYTEGQYADLRPAASFRIEGASSLRLWDVAASSSKVYVLMGSATETTLVETDLFGAGQKHFTLPAPKKFNSGRLRCYTTGQVYILRRAGDGGSDVTLVDNNGSIRNELATDQQVMDIGIVQGKIFGASTTEAYSIQNRGLFRLREVQLSYPFSLVPAPNGQVAAVEFQDGTVRTLSAAAAATPVSIKAPELDERTAELRRAGAGAVWGVASDENGDYYVGIPNFTSSMTGRILSFDMTGTLIRRLRFPLPVDPETKRHYHPFRFAVASRHLFMSVLEPTITIRSFTF